MLLLFLACDRAPDTGPQHTDSAEPHDTGATVDADGDGFSPESGDCDDDDPDVHPGAPERCNGSDDDCDGAISGEEDADSDGSPDCTACDSAGYWSAAGGTTSRDELTEALATLYTEDACKDYPTEREYLFLTLDNVDGTVEGLYTGTTFSIGDTLPDWDIVNTEHVWPRSAGSEIEPAECDLHHLFPSDASANNTRSSLPFGEVSSASWSEGGSMAGTDSTGAEVFEPRDARKGDIARAMLYFSVRYAEVADLKAQRTEAQVALFQAWHLADPPDEGERIRSNLIADRQGWDNPFVVCPELVERF